MPTNDSRFGSLAEVGHEGPVDLHDVDREPLQVGEAAVTRAEIVDGEADPRCGELFELHERDFAIVHDGGLGDLQLQAFGGHAVALQDVPHAGGEPGLVQVGGRDVDRHG